MCRNGAVSVAPVAIIFAVELFAVHRAQSFRGRLDCAPPGPFNPTNLVCFGASFGACFPCRLEGFAFCGCLVPPFFDFPRQADRNRHLDGRADRCREFPPVSKVISGVEPEVHIGSPLEVGDFGLVGVGMALPVNAANIGAEEIQLIKDTAHDICNSVKVARGA